MISCVFVYKTIAKTKILKKEVKFLEYKRRDIENIFTKLEDCVGDIDSEIANLVETVKALRVKLDRYDDIDAVIESMETKLVEMKTKGRS